MKRTRPAYYDSFRCLAGACPDSCCKDWAVAVDPVSAARYRGLGSSLGQRLRSVMVQEDGDTVLTLTPDRRCPMWREDSLCAIQAQLGEAALCDTCRQFPRLRHDYGDFVELGLELSCPEAARLILTGCHDPVTEQLPGGDAPDYDADAMSILLRSRAAALDLVADSRYTAGQLLAILLLYGYAVQDELDGGAPATLVPDALLREAVSLAAPGSLDALLSFYGSLEILTPQWRQLLSRGRQQPWSEPFRPLVRYFIHRYWLQAVSDYDLVGRIKLIAASCLVIRALGGKLLRTAQLYSKEIENDADNVDAILDGAYTSPALADIRLLGLLLEE